MPYFKWQGVNLFGDFKHGKEFARSQGDLDRSLFDRNISMLSCAPARVWSFFPLISLSEKINFLRQLSILLDAGVRLHDALKILCDQVKNIKLKKIIFQLEVDVQEGVSLANSIEKYPKIFDELIIKMIQVGQESGNLSYALGQLCDYLETTQQFRKKLKSAAILPLVTLGFFIVIAAAIFWFIVPKFVEMFKSFKQELPPLTKAVLKISTVFRSNLIILILFLFLLVFLILRRYFKCYRGKMVAHKICLSIPWFGDLIIDSSLVYFLQSVVLLIESGMRLLPALELSKKSIKNIPIKEHIEILEREVEAGSSLSQAMIDFSVNYFSQDLIAIVKVGEETGRLNVMLKKAAKIYQDKVDRSIIFFTTIFQPLLMIIVGLLITLLIFAIYVPIFNLSNVA